MLKLKATGLLLGSSLLILVWLNLCYWLKQHDDVISLQTNEINSGNSLIPDAS